MGVTYANGQLPLPSGAYGSGIIEIGVGAIYVPGLSPIVEEWSATKSPYYTYGDPVLRNGLVYYLNYAWDGITVGAPESQVDSTGNRVWSLSGANGNAQTYSNLQLRNNLTRYWGLMACHRLFDEYYQYGGKNVTLFEHGLNKDTLPKAYFNNGVEPLASFSVDVGANGIPANFYKSIITHNRDYPFLGGTNTTIGIFDSIKDFPYLQNGDPLGALHHSESISYTLTSDNWWLKPEYNQPTPLPTQTFTYTNTYGNTVNRTKTMWMTFVPETFLGRTFSGAFRVYKKFDNPNVLIERMELDSVSPDLITD